MLLDTLRSVATFLLVTALSAVGASAQTADRAAIAKLDAALSALVQKDESRWQRVIVQAAPNELPALTAALRARNNVVGRVHPVINALSASVPVAQLVSLTRLPSVVSISLDAVVTADQTASTEYTLRGSLGLPAQTQSGNRVGVAVIDSGLEAGPEFDDRIAGFYDFTQSGKMGTPTDPYGHGTHVAGLIAGNGDLSGKRYRGLAPKARLIVLKVLDQYGAGHTSDVISAIEFVTANKAKLGVDIINLSLGHPIYEPAATDPLVQAVEAAARAGIVVVASAGNHGVMAESELPGYAGIVSPANAPSAIAVGAVKTF
ncbi:MAG TPA: S8 family serine peptidase, partial [Woeseiaceae bacterium]